MNYRVLFVLFFVFSSCLGFVDHSVYLFSLDYLYPQKSFHQIESLSKELWSDLDLLLCDEEAQKKVIQENELYLYDQCKKLNNAVNNLILNETEARTYLTEDIQYLVAILEFIENKHDQLVSKVPTINEQTTERMQVILKEAKNTLINLLENNQEVIAA